MYFVGFLAIAAMGIVSKNILWPIYQMMVPRSAAAPKQVKKIVPIVVEEAKVEADIQAADLKNIGWTFGLKRDPFRNPKAPAKEVEPMAKAEVLKEEFSGVLESVDAAAKEEPESTEEEKAPPVSFENSNNLVAVMLDAGERLAVINDVIVSEGDYFKDYQVMEISQDAVLFKGPDGTKKLEF
jgi:hypothetical protein